MPLLAPLTPLTTEEITTLDNFLKQTHEEARPLNFTQAHGFFTALLSAPNPIQHGQWQPGFFRGTPYYKCEEEEFEIMSLLGRLNHQIMYDLAQQSQFYPLLFDNKKIVPYSKASTDLIGSWCEGYMYGTQLDIINPLDIELLKLVLPIWILAFPRLADKTMRNQAKDIFDKQLIRECHNMLPGQIKIIYDYWNSHSAPPQEDYFDHLDETLRDLSPSSTDFGGSHSLCPCGSGLKFIECCLFQKRSPH